VSFQLRFTPEAADDLQRFYTLLANNDPAAAKKALKTIGKAWEVLEEFPFSCRKAEASNPFLREMIISFGNSGYVALYEIENDEMVTVLAVRHQREDDYH
jgi:plasmid stabilization system protein ParE